MAGASSSLRQAKTWLHTTLFCCRVFSWGPLLIDISPLNPERLLVAGQWTGMSPWHPLQQNLIRCYSPSLVSSFQPEPGGLLSPLPQRALCWICSVWLPVVPGPWAGMMLICPQSLWLPPPPGTVSHSIHFLCTPRPGLHTSPSFSRRQLPVPPPMALSARSVSLTSQLQTTAPRLVLRWCCISPVGTGAAVPGLLPSSTPPLVLIAWRVVSCWYALRVPLPENVDPASAL